MSSSAKVRVADASQPAPLLARFVGEPPQSKAVAFKGFANKDKSKRCLAATSTVQDSAKRAHTIVWEGSSQKKARNGADSQQYLVGVYDQASETVKFMSVDQVFGMEQKPHRGGAVGDKALEDMDVYDQRRALTNTFGAKKKQKQLKASDANRINIDAVIGVQAVGKMLKSKVEKNIADITEDGNDHTVEAADQALIDSRLEEEHMVCRSEVDPHRADASREEEDRRWSIVLERLDCLGACTE